MQWEFGFGGTVLFALRFCPTADPSAEKEVTYLFSVWSAGLAVGAVFFGIMADNIGT